MASCIYRLLIVVIRWRPANKNYYWSSQADNEKFHLHAPAIELNEDGNCVWLPERPDWMVKEVVFILQGAKSLCLPLSACQCNYNHIGTRGGPWYPVDYGLNNMLEMRSFSLGLLCVRTGAVMFYIFLHLSCELDLELCILISRLHIHKNQGTNHSFG